jgi:hypothetical protein
MGIVKSLLGRRSPEEQAMREQLAAQEDSNLVNMARPTDWMSAGNSEQVSVYLVGQSRRFFKYVPKKFVNDSGEQSVVWVMNDRDFELGFIEPFSDDDPLSFSDDELRKVINDFDESLNSIYEYVNKYPLSGDELGLWISDFNQIVRLRQAVLANTRTTGKPPKLAKSQFVSGESSFRRVNEGKDQKRFGVF